MTKMKTTLIYSFRTKHLFSRRHTKAAFISEKFSEMMAALYDAKFITFNNIKKLKILNYTDE